MVHDTSTRPPSFLAIPWRWALAATLLAPVAGAQVSLEQSAYLKSSAPMVDDHFGLGVGISGDLIAVGASREDGGATGVEGGVFTFRREPISGAWLPDAHLKVVTPYPGPSLGAAVAVSGETLVAGAPLESSNAAGVGGTPSGGEFRAGAAYVFERDPQTGTWSQPVFLKALDPIGAPALPANYGDRFGESVAISGDTVVVGAPREDSGASGVDGDATDNSALDRGAAYVFARDPQTGVWSTQGYLKPPAGSSFFGHAVAVSGDTAVVGALYDSTGSNSAGAAYVYVRNPQTGKWSYQAQLVPHNAGPFDSFGSSVALSGDTVLVGAYGEASAATGVNGNGSDDSSLHAGAAYVFTRGAGGVWTEQAYLKASNTTASDTFGVSAALDGDRAVVGAQYDGGSGSAYPFERDPQTGAWSASGLVKAAVSDPTDDFGVAVAISGERIVVGASGEDSAIPGDPTDGSASRAGAAYVFEPPFPFEDLALGLAGAHGVPRLFGEGTLEGGSTVALTLDTALENSVAAWFLGATRVDAALLGGVLVPSPDVFVFGFPTGAIGGFTVLASVPAGIPTGTSIYMQMWIADPAGPQGYSATNGLELIFP